MDNDVRTLGALSGTQTMERLWAGPLSNGVCMKVEGLDGNSVTFTDMSHTSNE